jgi:hypothetical protein
MEDEMRLALMLAIATTLTWTSAVAAPRVLSVQGALRTASGSGVDGTYDMVLRLFPVQTGGSAVFTQTVTDVVVEQGVFDAALGPLPAGVEAAPALWLETEVEGTVLPRQPLRSVPWALSADQAAVALDLLCSGCVGAADVGFPYAAAATKGGAASDLECSGCVAATDLGAGVVAATHIQDGVVTPAKVSFAYAGSASKGGAAADLDCAGCVAGSEVAANATLQGDVTVTGSVDACSGGGAGCALSAGGARLVPQSDGWLRIESAEGVRIRDTQNQAWRPLVFGGGTSAGDLAITGNLAISGAISATGAIAGGTVSAGTVHATAAGVKFPDGTIQTTAAGSGGAGSGSVIVSDAVQPCGGDTKGTFWLSATNRMLYVCDGASWYGVAMTPLLGGGFGTGADGAVTFALSTNLTTTNSIIGRSCSDGGDAVSYSVSALTGTTATLSQAPAGGCLAVGDEVLLINLQGTASANGNVGNHEILRVSGLSGNVVSFVAPKQKNYGSGSSDDSGIGTSAGTQRVMLARVPNYSHVTVDSGVTLTANGWNGTRGGVLVFKVSGTLTVAGSINMDGKGFRGGAAHNSPAWNHGQPGESVGGTGAQSSQSSSAFSPNFGGGGGGHAGNCGPTWPTGAAGGSYGTLGGSGQQAGCGNWPGATGTRGNTYGAQELDSLHLGSGGGAGGSDIGLDGGDCHTGGDGGAGGGAIAIFAPTVQVSGTIAANGANGTQDRSSGGGGAGGSILLSTVNATLGSNRLLATGGGGAPDPSCSAGWSGGGGAGRIAIYYASSITGTTSPAAFTEKQ